MEGGHALGVDVLEGLADVRIREQADGRVVAGLLELAGVGLGVGHGGQLGQDVRAEGLAGLEAVKVEHEALADSLAQRTVVASRSSRGAPLTSCTVLAQLR